MFRKYMNYIHLDAQCVFFLLSCVCDDHKIQLKGAPVHVWGKSCATNKTILIRVLNLNFVF